MEVFNTINNLIYALAVSDSRFDRSEYMISIGEEAYKDLLGELRGVIHLYSLENVRDMKTFAGVEMVINHEEEHLHEIRIFKEVTADAEAASAKLYYLRNKTMERAKEDEVDE